MDHFKATKIRIIKKHFKLDVLPSPCELPKPRHMQKLEKQPSFFCIYFILFFPPLKETQGEKLKSSFRSSDIEL